MVTVVASASAETAGVLARRLATERLDIAVLGPARAALAVIAPELVREGARAVLAIPCELTDPLAVTAAVQRIEAELGPVERWVNAAMTDHAYVCCTRAAVACMRPRDRGTIVQVAAPRAVRMFSHGLRGELRLAGSRVSVETVWTQPFRKVGAATVAAATFIGALLLRRLVRAA
jgi:short-subunit dehydrogenase